MDKAQMIAILWERATEVHSRFGLSRADALLAIATAAIAIVELDDEPDIDDDGMTYDKEPEINPDR
jgi:hypothetical protein